MPRCTAKAPPPYSCTVVRTLNPSGVTSVGEDQGSPRITTPRPCSDGRVSSQYATPSSSHTSLRPMPALESIDAVIGDDHEPNGAVVGSVIAVGVRR